MGVYPLRDRYYEPMFNVNNLRRSLREDRNLPGIDWNVEEQLSLLEKFHWQNELQAFPTTPAAPPQYTYANDTFAYGDAEFLYNMIRHVRPKRIVEIGSGNSTLMAIAAIKANKADDSSYVCDHACVEPFECPWLTGLPIRLIRELVENVDKTVFSSLQAGDILFIDSSHVIRPQGDVLYEVLELLPQLPAGVFVHIHDIFSPKDYLDRWVHEDMRLWNEQYLIEAFLSGNRSFKIVGAVNYLKHHHENALSAACPMLGRDPKNYEPGSFWLRKEG
jgi:hypothetical protein